MKNFAAALVIILALGACTKKKETSITKTDKDTFVFRIHSEPPNVDPAKGVDNVYRLLENKGGRTVTLLLNKKPTTDGAHEETVSTITSEQKRDRDFQPPAHQIRLRSSSFVFSSGSSSTTSRSSASFFPMSGPGL